MQQDEQRLTQEIADVIAKFRRCECDQSKAVIGLPGLAGMVNPSGLSRDAGLICIAVKSVAVKSSSDTGLDFT